MEKVNIVEPSQSMQRAGRDLIQGNFTLIVSDKTLRAVIDSDLYHFCEYERPQGFTSHPWVY